MDKGYLSKDNPFDSKTLLLDRNKQKLQQDYFTEQEYNLLTQGNNFCMLPWIHMHGWSDGNAYPCCMSDPDVPIGNLRDNTLEEVWNNDTYKRMRLNMLNNKPSKECVKCYEKERNGFYSLRNESNRNFAYAIKDINTEPDGSSEPNPIYWDIRFTNLCNFRCRMCGPQFSSNWVKEYNAMYGGDLKIEYTRGNKQLNWEMIEPYIDNLHKIYWAGGEPLMMEEHWRIMDELIKREMFNVQLVYNTNFSEVKYKGRSVFDMWKLFDDVSIGASLDGMGERAEYIRKGTVWDTIVRNRYDMLDVCPDVDFFPSATLQVLNAYHLPAFHNDWVERGLIGVYDFHVNILQGPDYYRLSILPDYMKEEVKSLYEEHISSIADADDIKRATNGFESAINFMYSEDRTDLIPKFQDEINKYDRYRNENFHRVFPELKGLWGRNYGL
jgi:sulfatase maturation enzyme AslB (radical SAM superfamily)